MKALASGTPERLSPHHFRIDLVAHNSLGHGHNLLHRRLNEAPSNVIDSKDLKVATTRQSADRVLGGIPNRLLPLFVLNVREHLGMRPCGFEHVCQTAYSLLLPRERVPSASAKHYSLRLHVNDIGSRNSCRRHVSHSGDKWISRESLLVGLFHSDAVLNNH